MQSYAGITVEYGRVYLHGVCSLYVLALDSYVGQETYNCI